MDLREELIPSLQIDSMLFLGSNVFQELNGEVVQNVAFILCKQVPSVTSTLFQLSGGDSDNKRERFVSKTTEPKTIDQLNFLALDTKQICYISDTFLNILGTSKPLSKFGVSKQGLATGDMIVFTILV